MVATMLLAVVGGVLAAVLGHPWGVAPIIAGVLCAACFLRGSHLYIVGVGAMLLRDVIVGVSLFTPIRIIAVLAVIAIAQALRVRLNRPIALIGALIIAAPVYHLILNVGDWAVQLCAAEGRTASGLWTTLTSAWPYFQQSFALNLLVTFVCLGVYISAGYVLRLRWPTIIPRLSHS
jgi:hypothetical protein